MRSQWTGLLSFGGLLCLDTPPPLSKERGGCMSGHKNRGTLMLYVLSTDKVRTKLVQM